MLTGSGMKKLLPIIAASLLLLPVSPCRAAEGGIYAGLQAGMFLPIESSVHGDYVGPDATVTYNPGVVLSAVGGYGFENGLRAEGEIDYRRLTTDKLLNGSNEAAADSGIRSYAMMANLYYDFRTRTPVTPYIGAGVGLALTRFHQGTSAGRVIWSSDQDATVAYQGIAGFALRVSEQTSLDFVYHHFAVPRLHFDTLSSQFRGINLSFGIRQWF